MRNRQNKLTYVLFPHCSRKSDGSDIVLSSGYIVTKGRVKTTG